MNGNGHVLPDGFRRIVSETTGKVTFEVVAGVVNGSKVRKQFGEATFGSEAAAMTAAKHWYAEKRGEIRKDRRAVLSVSDHTRLAVLEAEERLRPYKKTLLQAVNVAIEVWKAEEGVAPMTIRDAAAKFIAHKQIEESRPRYVKNLETSMNALTKDFGDELVSKVTAGDLQDWLLKREISALTWNNWRRDLRVFFNFCRKTSNGWTKTNPAEGIAHKKVDEKEVVALSVAEARKVLNAALEICPRQVPWMVLGMFCGFRPGQECDDATWEDVDWEGRSMKVNSEKVRGAPNRYVQLADAPIAFLSAFRREAGAIGTGTYARREDLRKLSKATGIDCLGENIFRHSFGSYHYALHEHNMAFTMGEMGHTNATTFLKWYRKPIKKIEAHAYWNIRPDNLG